MRCCVCVCLSCVCYVTAASLRALRICDYTNSCPDRKSESRQMTPGHAFDFVSQIWTLVHVYDSGHARMTQGGDRLSSNMLT